MSQSKDNMKRGDRSPVVLGSDSDAERTPAKKPKLQATTPMSERNCEPKYSASTKAERERIRQEKELERQRKKEEREQERLRKEAERKQKEEEKEQERLRKETERKQREEEKEQEKQRKELERKNKELERLEQKKQRDAEIERKRLEREEEKKVWEQKRMEKAEEKRSREEARRQKDEEKRRKVEEAEEKKRRQSEMFRSFFREVKVEERKNWGISFGRFKPFEIKEGMILAPILMRQPLSAQQHDSLMNNSVENSDYFDRLPKRPFICKDPLRAKLFQFHENYRPPYYGTWRQRSEIITGRRPFAKAPMQVNYDRDSEDDWEPEPSEGDDCASDKDSAKGEDYETDGFLMNHGYLSSNEGSDAEEGVSIKHKRRASEFSSDRNRKDNRYRRKDLETRVYGITYTKPTATNCSFELLRHFKGGFQFQYAVN